MSAPTAEEIAQLRVWANRGNSNPETILRLLTALEAALAEAAAATAVCRTAQSVIEDATSLPGREECVVDAGLIRDLRTTVQCWEET